MTTPPTISAESWKGMVTTIGDYVAARKAQTEIEAFLSGNMETKAYAALRGH